MKCFVVYMDNLSVAFSRSLHSSRSFSTQYAAVIITSYMQCVKGCTDKSGYNGQVKVLCPKCFNEFVYLWKSVVKLVYLHICTRADNIHEHTHGLHGFTSFTHLSYVSQQASHGLMIFNSGGTSFFNQSFSPRTYLFH